MIDTIRPSGAVKRHETDYLFEKEGRYFVHSFYAHQDREITYEEFLRQIGEGMEIR